MFVLFLKGKPCKLAVDFVDNIVARVTMLEVDSTNPTIHGVPLGKGNMRVVIDIVINAEALLPFPIKDDDISTVGQAVGYVMAWPKQLVILLGHEMIKHFYIFSIKKKKKNTFTFSF